MEKRNYKGKRRGKPTRRDEANRKEGFRESRSVDPKPNDPSWYVGDPNLLSAVANLSFNQPTGLPVVLDGTSGDSTTIPGIMNIFTAPSPGISSGTYSKAAPVNVAALNIYSFIRHANSGHANYDAPDYMMYLLAMDSIYSYISYLTRIYGVLRLYSSVNRYVNEGWLRAFGVQPDGETGMYANVARLRSYINTYISRVKSFAVPNSMSYFVRHFWMYSSIFKDEDNSRAQYYMYSPAYLYKFSINSTTSVGELTPVDVAAKWDSNSGYLARTSANLLTITNLQDIGDSLLTAILYNEDIGIMSGDTLKAFGENGLFTINTIPDDYVIMPMFSEEILLQIHNTQFSSGAVVNSSGTPTRSILNIKQDTSIGGGTLIFKPTFAPRFGTNGRTILDSWKEIVAPEDVMVMSRNVINTSQGDTSVSLRSTGSDFALFAAIYLYSAASSVIEPANVYNQVPTATRIAGELVNGRMGVFNQRPLRIVVEDNNEHTKYAVDGELSNYVSVDQSVIDRLHENALCAMYGIPYTKW